MTKADGSAGARRASALLGIAACAETAHTTLLEDYAKVDMKFSFRHAHEPERLITLHAQVKSGESYRAKSSDDRTLVLGIDKKTIRALSGNGIPGLVVWVPPSPMSRLYWYGKDPRRRLKTPVRISKLQYVRPSIRYDLSQLATYASFTQPSARQTVRDMNPSAVMARAKEAYSALKSATWTHPLAGTLHVTRLAWRHVTRRSRTASQRLIRLRVVPYLKAFLNKPPDRYVCVPKSLRENGKRTVEDRYLLCWYRGALEIAGVTHTLLVRIREQISYPTKWQDLPLGEGDIRQTATLESWWCKKEQ